MTVSGKTLNTRFAGLPDARLLLVCFASLLFFAKYTLSSPYHYDTAAYLEAVRQLLETGQYEQLIPARMFNIYPYVLPVALFGEAGFKAANVLIVTLFLAAYYVLLKRDFSAHTAFLSSLLVLSIPSSVITVTHLKEDFNSLLLLTVAFIFLGKGAGRLRSFASGAALGLAFLFKEFPIALMPFFAACIVINAGEVKGFRELFSRRPYVKAAPLVVSLTAGFSLSVLALQPKHFLLLYSLWTGPGVGKFLGIFSRMQEIGYSDWTEGLLYAYPLHVLLLLSAAVFIKRRNFNALLWLLAAVATFILISNNNAVRPRHFVWSAFFSLPVIVESATVALRGLARRKALMGLALVYVVVFGVAFFNVLEGLPALELRNKYNAQEAFFGGLKESLPANSTLLGMDFCMLASYYSGFDCMVHPTYPDEKSCLEHLDKIEEAMLRGRVYRLPDFFTYDRGGVCRKMFYDRFQERAVYWNYMEDFHLMTYGKSTEKSISGAVDERKCEFLGEKESKDLEVLPGLTLKERTLSFRCRDAYKPYVYLKLLEYKGRSFIFPASVYEVGRKTLNTAWPVVRGGQ